LIQEFETQTRGFKTEYRKLCELWARWSDGIIPAGD